MFIIWLAWDVRLSYLGNRTHKAFVTVFKETLSVELSSVPKCISNIYFLFEKRMLF